MSHVWNINLFQLFTISHFEGVVEHENLSLPTSEFPTEQCSANVGVTSI